MYIPQSFREDRIEELHAVIRDYSFGTLVSPGDGELVASHLPFLLDAERGPCGTLLAHMARANPQWQAFAGAGEVLAMFQGPHAYISPEWYAEPHSVPTWNYVAVHAYGTPELISDPEAVRAFLAAMARTFEPQVGQAWDPDRLPSDLFERLLGAIVAFEIPIARLEGKWKLGQNRPRADREGAVAGLRRSGGPEEMARLMEAGLPGG